MDRVREVRVNDPVNFFDLPEDLRAGYDVTCPSQSSYWHNHEGRCQAALPPSYMGLSRRCSISHADGQIYCWAHGGVRKNPAAKQRADLQTRTSMRRAMWAFSKFLHNVFGTDSDADDAEREFWADRSDRAFRHRARILLGALTQDRKDT